MKKQILKPLISKMFNVFLVAVLLLTACSKDQKNKPAPDPTDPIEEVTKGTISATITFENTGKTLEFSGKSIGGMLSGEQGDTLGLAFGEGNIPATFEFILMPVKEETLVIGENMEVIGAFNEDSLQTGGADIYDLGWPPLSKEDGVEYAATFKITTLNEDRVKGTFTATMVSNSTVKDGDTGEILEGEIKSIKVTNGKFDAPLVYK